MIQTWHESAVIIASMIHQSKRLENFIFSIQESGFLDSLRRSHFPVLKTSFPVLACPLLAKRALRADPDTSPRLKPGGSQKR